MLQSKKWGKPHFLELCCKRLQEEGKEYVYQLRKKSFQNTRD